LNDIKWKSDLGCVYEDGKIDLTWLQNRNAVCSAMGDCASTTTDASVLGKMVSNGKVNWVGATGNN
jgi:hypothetical protein